MKTHTLNAEARVVTGRKVKKLRAGGSLPANIYGNKVKSQSVSVSTKDFLKTYQEAGETGLVEVTLGKEKRPVLIHNVQFHPVSGEPLHVDLLQVDLKEKVTAQVPVETVGESPAEKQGGATVVMYLKEVEVESLPGDLPEKFEIDLSALSEVGMQVAVKDLKYDRSKIKVTQEEDQIVVKVEAQKVEEEVVMPSAEATAEEGQESSEAKAGETTEEAPTEKENTPEK